MCVIVLGQNLDWFGVEQGVGLCKYVPMAV